MYTGFASPNDNFWTDPVTIILFELIQPIGSFTIPESLIQTLIKIPQND